MRVIQCGLVLCLLGAAVATATPKLRLSTAAVGPITTNVGSIGSPQTVSAYNAGDGTLSLTAASSVSWLAPSVGTSGPCVLASSCIPLKIALNTSALARGLYTGVITVSSPNAIDAPQNITVTVQVGSGIPDSLTLYVAPGSSATSSFTTPSALQTNVTNPSAGATLSVAVVGGGSFGFNRSYQIAAKAPASSAPGSYSGSIAFSGSALAGDNKSVPVTVQVTSQPIAVSSSSSLLFRIAQGAAPSTQAIAIGNNGSGTLAVSGVTFAGASTTWITATTQGNYVFLTADPTGLSPGVFTVTASVASNAANGPVTVPIELDVLATGPPITYYQGVLDNATFAVGSTLAPGGIVALFGEQLITGPPVQAAALPLTTTLGGAMVMVNGQPAPVYYASATQIDFIIPYGAASGSATVSVSRAGQLGNSVGLKIASVAPTILPLGISNYGNIVLGDLVTRPIPTTPGIPSRPAVAGTDSIVIYALGMGQTTPPVSDGVAAPSAEPLARISGVTVVFGNGFLAGTGVDATPAFAGLAPGFVGLYQVNVVVPSGSPRGSNVPVSIQLSGQSSNYGDIAVQ